MAYWVLIFEEVVDLRKKTMKDTDFEVDMEVIVEKIEKENRIYRIMEGMDLA